MGQRHARVLQSLDERFHLVGGHDPDSTVATPSGCERFRSEAEAIAGADVVVVATPIESHGQLVARALAAGRHVLVEKPICATADEARAAEGAARASTRLFVGHSERFNPVVRALVKLLRDDEVLSIEMRRVGPTKPCAAGVLVNLGVHDLDLASYLAGEVVLRGAVGFSAGAWREGTTPDPGPGPDAAHVLFATSRGAVGHLHVDRAAIARRRSIEVATLRWIYQGDLMAHRLVRTSRATGACADVPLPLEEPLRAQAIALADALDGGSHREIATGGEGLRALDLAERAAVLCRNGEAGASAENLSEGARRC
jgi:predicted dehydrogenase